VKKAPLAIIVLLAIAAGGVMVGSLMHMNPAAVILRWIGGLVPTALVSRLVLRLVRNWVGGVWRFVLCDAATLVLVILFTGVTFSEGGQFAGVEALGTYGPPCLLIFLFDLRTLRQGDTMDVGPTSPSSSERKKEPSF
jgi:hypothetical protein